MILVCNKCRIVAAASHARFESQQIFIDFISAQLCYVMICVYYSENELRSSLNFVVSMFCIAQPEIDQALACSSPLAKSFL